MNETESLEKNPKESTDMKPTNRKTGSVIDKAWPPVWIMASAVGVVVVLLVISGWKIVNLDQEKAALQKERSLFERDKKAYAVLLSELPTLEGKKMDLTNEVNVLEGKARTHQTRIESLKVQVSTVDSRHQSLRADAKINSHS